MPASEQHAVLCEILTSHRGWFTIDEFSRFIDIANASPLILLQTIDTLIQKKIIKPLSEKGAGYYAVTDEGKKAGAATTLQDDVKLDIAEYFSENHHDVTSEKRAWHWQLAGKTDKAIPLLINGAKESFLVHDTEKGLDLSDRVFNLIYNLSDSDEHGGILLNAFIDLFESTPLFRNYSGIELAIDRMKAVSSARPSSDLSFIGLVYGLTTLIWQGKFDKAESLISLIIKNHKNISGKKYIEIKKWLPGLSYFLKGAISKAINAFDSLAPDTEKLPDDPEFLEYYLYVAYCYVLNGRVEKGIALLDAIRTHARSKAVSHVEYWAVSSLVTILVEIGSFKKAKLLISELTEVENDWKDYLPVRVGCCWAEIYIDFCEERYENINANFAKLFFDYSHTLETAGFSPPSPVEVCVGLSGLKQSVIEKYDLSLVVEMCKARLKEDTVFPNIRAMATGFMALRNYRQTKNSAEAIKYCDNAIRRLDETGYNIAISRVKVIKATILWEEGRADEASDVLKSCLPVIENFGDRFLSGFLRDLLKPESPEKLMHYTIMNISHSLGTLSDKDTFIQNAIESMNRLSRSERGAVFLFEEQDNKKHLILKASQGITSEYTLSDDFKDMYKWIRQVADTEKGEVLSFQENKSFFFKPKSALCAPLIIRDQIVGAVYQDNRIFEKVYDQNDIDRVQAMGTIIASSIENTKIYKKMGELNNFLLEKNAYYEEVDLKDRLYDELVGKSGGFKKVISLVKQVADYDASVLLTGETGVGKEKIAHLLHKSSGRKAKAFIKVNCAALPESLIESELFGHEAGAFTDAKNARIGRFELADGGTIFLDEIGELPMSIQAKFLRVLQEGQIERLGSTKSKYVDVRVIAATNRNLSEEVEKGNFRADLFYRLNDFPIHIPPLRERKSDIPVLACYFFEKTDRKLGKGFEGITKSDINLLKDYSWPGNIRELKQVIERSAILSRDNTFRLSFPLNAEPSAIQSGDDKIIPLKEMEKRYITNALIYTRWKVAGPGGASELLELNRNTLISKMKKLGIKKPWLTEEP